VRHFDPGPRPWIAGHRGALPAIENTVPSLLQALAEGADFVECDAQVTADGALALFHDEAPAPAFDLTAPRIAERTLADWRASEREIHSLVDLFDAVPSGARVNVELKSYGADRGRLAEAALATFRGRHGLLVSSFDHDLLLRLREADPGLPLAPLAEGLSRDLIELARRLDAWAIHLGVAPEAAEIAHLDRPVLIYTVNDPGAARELFERGCAGLFTDWPGPLRRGIEALGPWGRGVV
jgi:glycerophosphoryl diester phosphodiesterase